MDPAAVESARERVAHAASRATAADVDAALERARAQLEAFAQAASELEAALPAQIGEAVQAGIRTEVAPASRQLAETRGLLNQVLRRLERQETDQLAERHARVDDLALLVELITSGWASVDERLAKLEERLERAGGAVVYRIEDRQAR
jgi:hypothetical protein